MLQIIRYINDLAEKVILAYDISFPIPDMDSVVQRIGGRVAEGPNLDMFSDGVTRKEGRLGFCIAVAPSQPQTRRTFTIAHALGHLFLHMGFRTDWALWERQDASAYKQFSSSAAEYQANAFAAALLMPRDQFAKAIERYIMGDRVDITKVAEYLNVSPAAAIDRGRTLGYL